MLKNFNSLVGHYARDILLKECQKNHINLRLHVINGNFHTFYRGHYKKINRYNQSKVYNEFCIERTQNTKRK